MLTQFQEYLKKNGSIGPKQIPYFEIGLWAVMPSWDMRRYDNFTTPAQTVGCIADTKVKVLRLKRMSLNTEKTYII